MKAPQKRAPRQITLLEGKHRLGEEYLVRLKSVENREDAIQLRGHVMYAREEDKIKPAEQEEFLIEDLVGLAVYLQDSVDSERTENPFVGTVAGVVFAEEMCSIPGLGHDMLEVSLPRGTGGLPSVHDELVLIPFVP